MNEPGTVWDWSISGFVLLVEIIERTSGQSFDAYMRQHVYGPAGMKSTTLCDDFTMTPGLSPGYRRAGDGDVQAAENGMAFNYDLRYCSTVGDLARGWQAELSHKLIKAETLKQMSTAAGPSLKMSPTDPEMHYGLALTLNHEDKHRSRGQHGSLLRLRLARCTNSPDDLAHGDRAHGIQKIRKMHTH